MAPRLRVRSVSEQSPGREAEGLRVRLAVGLSRMPSPDEIEVPPENGNLKVPVCGT